MAIGKMPISPDIHGKLGEGASDDVGRQFRDALRGGRLLGRLGRPQAAAPLRYPSPRPESKGEPVVPGPRDYTPRTLMSLAHLSGGLCYWPGCPEPVLRDVGGQMHRIVEIAHIRGAYPGGARYSRRMTDDQRRDLPNLMLFCDPHHNVVDAKDNEKIYTAEVLLEVEGSARVGAPRGPETAARSHARRLAQDRRRRTSTARRQAPHRTGPAESNDREAAALMRSLVDELTEAYARQQHSLNPILVQEFSAATYRLTEMSDMIEELSAASIRLHDSRRYLGGPLGRGRPDRQAAGDRDDNQGDGHDGVEQKRT